MRDSRQEVVGVTEREFEKLRDYRRDSSNNHYHRNHDDEKEEPQDGYFAYFKLRCLICFVLFLGLIALDQQLDIKENEKVQQAMSMLNEEEITIEECFQMVE